MANSTIMAGTPLPLLIDINILERLISEDGKSPSLARLYHLVQKGKVILLCPQALLEEWPRNRGRTKDRHLKALKPDQRDVNKLKTINNPAAEWSEERLLEFRNLYNRQLDCIDMLLANGKTIPRTEDQGRMIDQLRKGKKAPFHNGAMKNNTNDAELIYYSVDYLEQNAYGELYFLSDNYKEFGKKTNGIISLHPDLANYKPGIVIHYFSDINFAYKAFDELGLPDTPPEESLEFKRVKNTILIDRQAPLIDQILEYLEKRLHDTPFLPKELFAEHYPFISDDFFDSHPRPFTLNVDNMAVYELLAPGAKGMGITATPPISHDEASTKKLQRIRQYLFDLNIYRISHKLRDEVQLEYDPEGVRTNTHLLKYHSHDFLGLLDDIAAEDSTALTGDIRKDLRKAFTFYKLTHYRGAAALLLKMKNAYKGQRSVHYYICCFNLNRIAQLVRHSYWGDSETLAMAKECLGPNLKKEKAAISEPHYQDLLEYIHRTEFFSDNFFELQTALNDIRDYNHRQNSGFNKDAEKLLEHYFCTETFLHENCIVFDRYNEFSALTSQYVEGVISSYGCDDSLGGKISTFSDDHLIPIIFYGKPEEIKNHFERYKITSLKYQPAAAGSSIYKLVSNILDQYVFINEKYSDTIKTDMTEFFDHYIRRLANSLLILSVLDMDKGQLDNIARKLLSFLIVQTHVPPAFFSKWVRLFLLRNRRKLSAEVWQDYFLGILRHKPLHEGLNISVLTHVFELRQLSLKIPEVEFDGIIENFLGKCQLCNDNHTWHDLADIYRSLQDQEQKSRVSEMVKASLSHCFDPERYSIAVVSDVIQPDDGMTQQCVDIVSALVEAAIRHRLSNRKDYYTDKRLDQMINLYWKLGIDIPEPIQKALPKLGSYYNWISDMEGFDYSGFNPEWIHHSFTKYYKRKFRKSNALKEYLIEAILSDAQEEYLKDFFTIYGKDD